MANETFQLKIVRRLLDDDIELSQALGLPEVSALSDSESRGRQTLQAKAKGILEEEELCPTISLHRRRLGAELELDSLELTFEPPRRAPDWEQSVQLRVHFVRWAEGDLHHAFVPGLDVHVFASRASLLPERVEQHIRLLLAGRGRRLTLRRLGQLARVQELRLGQLDVTVQRKTPKQLAQAGQLAEEKKSVLSTLAEELPPQRPRADGANQPSSLRSLVQRPAAFEMELELQQLAEALAGPHRRSVLLVGLPGTGKTALVHELARRRQEFGFGATPFWSTNGARLMTGPIGFGMWQERCQQLCREVAKQQAILHLHHVAELLEVGKASRGEQSVGSFLRPWIARGEVLTIAECTPEQLSMLERDEPHLLGAFQQLPLPPRTPEQTRSILSQVLAAAPGQTTNTASSQHALERLHALHQRYATYSANPGRPLRFLKNLLADQFPEKNLQESQVITAFSRETGLPLALLDDDVPLALDATSGWFTQRVIGQPEAVARVVDLLVLIKARLARPHKPLASLLFIGPTGTGKTEMAKALAEFLFGDPARLVRFDLNEFSEPIAVQRLIGGLTACDAEGLLTARVREQPFSVVLLDEFEKADTRFFDLLLQILGDGRLTDAAGRVADFCNTVLVMTSNLGAQAFQRGLAGFRADGDALPEAQTHFSEAVRQFLRPEIYNRLDAIVPFRTLPLDDVRAIARRHLDLLCLRDGVRLRSVQLALGPEVADRLAELGFDPRYGARPLKRALERELLVPLAEALNQYQTETPLEVNISTVDGRIRIQTRALSDAQTHREQEAAEHLAERVVRQRRLIGRLERGRAVTKLSDEVVMLESLERRLAAAKRHNPVGQARVGMLHSLRECLRAVSALATRARQLETEALASLYQRETPEHTLVAAELEALEVERLKLMRQVFRRQYDQPDDIVLAFYSENQDILFQFADAYQKVGRQLGEVIGLDYFLPPPGGRSSKTKLVRETPKQAQAFFLSPPPKVIGIALHLRGDFFFPRFQPEAGRHVVKAKKKEHTCLVEAVGPPFSSYEPPAGIERQGALQGRGAPLCRTYETEESVIHDEVLGERPWPGLELPRCLKDLTEQRLQQTIETATT